MTRLNPEPLASAEGYAVVTNQELTHTAKVVWSYLRFVSDPQHMKPMARALVMDPETVSRSLKSLESHGLARKVNGVWLPEGTE
ncbi:hypothetical protein [Streptomyces californicus]|uniref:hypothetical protein n=1 Tax=Streptomyces californicus TaxID=67351 RepID=UPI0034011ED1